MLYFATASSPEIIQAMNGGILGRIDAPHGSATAHDAKIWCADNGCYGNSYPGDIPFLTWLARRRSMAPRCSFVVLPDVPFDARATLARSVPFSGIVRAMGYRTALAAQDGLEDPSIAIPWDEFDTFFIAGTTGWKLSPAAAGLAQEALTRHKHVHMGRVNTKDRLRYAASIGAHSADGTTLAHAPSQLPALLRWLREINEQELPPCQRTHTHTCAHCHTRFTPARTDARTCSDRCRQALSRQARAARAAPAPAGGAISGEETLSDTATAGSRMSGQVADLTNPA